MHDLSKYSPVEFIPGAKYYQGFQSPNNMERKVKGYSSAWLHHKGRNKHHLEYWIDYAAGGEPSGLTGMEMPVRFVVEMFCDPSRRQPYLPPGEILGQRPLGILRAVKGRLSDAPELPRAFWSGCLYRSRIRVKAKPLR